MYADSSAVYVLADSSLVKYGLNGTELWTRPAISGKGFSGDSTGVYVTTSYVTNGFLSKYDHDGNRLWTVQFSSPSYGGVGNPLIAAGSAGVFVKMFDGSGNSWVNRYDSNGNRLWSLQATNIIPDGGTNSIAAGPDGFYEGGSVQGNALVDEFSVNSSLVFFGVNPPWSFLIVGSLLGTAGGGLFFLRRMRRNRARPQRVGPPERSLPATD
jgi:hypothetical protein